VFDADKLVNRQVVNLPTCQPMAELAFIDAATGSHASFELDGGGNPG
jgi:hypothetical protein